MWRDFAIFILGLWVGSLLTVMFVGLGAAAKKADQDRGINE